MEVTEEEGKEDRISLLGDCLLTEILSRLPSTKDAIRTSSLSKRWKHIWTYVHTLILQISDFKLQPRRTEIFFSSIDKTLAQHRQLNLKKFRLHAPYGGQFDSQISNWIRYALSCNVEELDLNLLNLDFKSKFVLDESIFINSCLTDVKLVNCILNPTGAISWNNLNRLYISCGNLDEDLIENILSGYNLLDIASKSDKVKVGKSCSKMLCYLEAQGLVYPSNMEFSDIIPSDLQLLLISGDLFS